MDEEQNETYAVLQPAYLSFLAGTAALRACGKSVIRMLCCYKFAINSQKFFGISNNIAKNFCEFMANFSIQTIEDFKQTLSHLK